MAKSIFDQISGKDVIWACGWFLSLASHYYMLKMEIHDIGSKQESDMKVVNYRLNALESTNRTSESNKKTSYYFHEAEAIIPDKIKIR